MTSMTPSNSNTCARVCVGGGGRKREKKEEKEEKGGRVGGLVLKKAIERHKKT